MPTPSRTGFLELDASAGNYSASQTIPAGTNGAVGFHSHWDSDGNTGVASVSINGVGFILDSQINEGATSGQTGVSVFHLASPATGSQTVALNYTGGGARTEGGEFVLVFYQDCDVLDMVRAADTDSQLAETAPSAAIGSTVSTDRVVGFCETYYQDQFSTPIVPTINGVTAFIDDTELNQNQYDVGDATGISGTATVTNSGDTNYGTAAVISLKASEDAWTPEVDSPKTLHLLASPLRFR